MGLRLYKKARLFSLDTVPDNRLNIKPWFQSWLLKIARLFGLDAVQGSKEKRVSRIEKYGERVSYVADDAMRQEGWQSFGFAGSRLARPKSAGGFTIVELTIATAIFSIVLLVALASFLGICKIFYKGITLTQTQSATQTVMDQLSNDIQFASGVVPSQATGTGAQFLCIGNARYTYNLYQEVNLDVHDNTSHFGLLRDVLPGSSGCANPFGASAVALNNPTELLGNKMRLSKLTIAPAKNSAGSDILDLWNINLTLSYGDDSSLQNGGTATPVCDANLNSTQFCAVVNLGATLNRGL